MKELLDGGLNREDKKDATEDEEREHQDELRRLSGAHRRAAPVAALVAELDVESGTKGKQEKSE
jgi:hypothetical protein